MAKEPRQNGLSRLWYCLGFAAMLTTANVQTPPPATPNTQFDGVYAPVSMTNVNEIYHVLATNRIGRCEDYRFLPPLIIIDGRVRRYKGEGELFAEGAVGPHGELLMRYVPEVTGKFAGGDPGIEAMITARIDSDGMVTARHIGGRCNYDLSWRKVRNLPSPAVGTRFDGTYARVSVTQLNETYVNRVTGQKAPCPKQGAATLFIINGQAHSPSFEGTVGSHGELTMLRALMNVGQRPGVDGTIRGTIDKDGSIKARRMTGGCEDDVIWQKEPK